MELHARAEDKTPYVLVALQECERMNLLTREMRRSLRELDLGLKVRSCEVSWIAFIKSWSRIGLTARCPHLLQVCHFIVDVHNWGKRVPTVLCNVEVQSSPFYRTRRYFHMFYFKQNPQQMGTAILCTKCNQVACLYLKCVQALPLTKFQWYSTSTSNVVVCLTRVCKNGRLE